MKFTEACDNAGKRVTHVPTGRVGTLTGFSGLVRVFVRYDGASQDEWGTLPEELELVTG